MGGGGFTDCTSVVYFWTDLQYSSQRTKALKFQFDAGHLFSISNTRRHVLLSVDLLMSRPHQALGAQYLRGTYRACPNNNISQCFRQQDITTSLSAVICLLSGPVVCHSDRRPEPPSEWSEKLMYSPHDTLAVETRPRTSCRLVSHVTRSATEQRPRLSTVEMGSLNKNIWLVEFDCTRHWFDIDPGRQTHSWCILS